MKSQNYHTYTYKMARKFKKGSKRWGRRKGRKQRGDKYVATRKLTFGRRLKGSGYNSTGLNENLYQSRLNPFPVAEMKVFTYATQSSQATAGGTAHLGVTNVLQLNALNAPEFGGGHQPSYFDNLLSSAGPYRRYRVYECTAEVTFFNPPSDVATIIAFCIPQNSTSGAGGDPAGMNIGQAIEQMGTWSAVIAANGSRTVTYARTFKMWEMDGIPYLQWLADPDYDGTYNVAPAKVPTLRLSVADISAAATSNVATIIKLYYKTQLKEPLLAAQS